MNGLSNALKWEDVIDDLLSHDFARHAEYESSRFILSDGRTARRLQHTKAFNPVAAHAGQ